MKLIFRQIFLSLLILDSYCNTKHNDLSQLFRPISCCCVTKYIPMMHLLRDRTNTRNNGLVIEWQKTMIDKLMRYKDESDH